MLVLTRIPGAIESPPHAPSAHLRRLDAAGAGPIRRQGGLGVKLLRQPHAARVGLLREALGGRLEP